MTPAQLKVIAALIAFLDHHPLHLQRPQVTSTPASVRIDQLHRSKTLSSGYGALTAKVGDQTYHSAFRYLDCPNLHKLPYFGGGELRSDGILIVGIGHVPDGVKDTCDVRLYSFSKKIR